MNEPTYYAVIPADVRYDGELSPSAKLLYGEITALSNKTGYCWASNQHFAELYGVSERAVSEWVGILATKGYIEIELEGNGRLGRKIHIARRKVRGTTKKSSTKHEEKFYPSIKDNTKTIYEKDFFKEKEEPEIEESNENTDPEGKWQENSEGTQLWVPSRAWKALHQKKTQKMIPRSFKKETFVYDDYMAKLRSATLTDKIVAFIWDEKGYHFDNLEQVKTQFGLDAPFAKKLTGYSKDQVYRAIRKAKEMGEKNGFDWKASTVVKVIAETNKI